MELCNQFICMKKPFSNTYQNHHALFSFSFSFSLFPRPKLGRVTFRLSPSLSLSQPSLQSETLNILEWGSVCHQLSSFTSTSMGLEVARTATVPIGKTREESQKLLDQTGAAMAATLALSKPLDFSGIDDVAEVLNSATSGQLLTASELCAVARTLKAATDLYGRLQDVAGGGGDCVEERCRTLLEILQDCDFQVEFVQKVEFCIDSNLLIILDRASEELEFIRSERKRNMENLDSLLKDISARIFQAGATDRPVVTRRRSRMCVGVRATHRHLLSGGLVLDASRSGATYFMEPKEAMELNNMEVRLSNLEKAEERIILSLLTSEIAKSELEIKYLFDRIVEIDLAFARASYAQWINGVCPRFSSEGSNPSVVDNALLVDIEGIKHPILLESSLRRLTDDISASSDDPAQLDEGDSKVASTSLLEGVSDFPKPIDIKVKSGTRVVVISGPNTGGKTASMKTLGLASLMSKAGMYLPAKNCPRLPWFDAVLADIGDRQSLEQNLSTFSGHILRICKILEVASKESLVLIDEIGSGTDPSEGVSLSSSILHFVKDRVNLAVVTTHYADLSLLREKDARFENAAMEFSLETLQPTYRILWGSTGNSNALSIAKTIGFNGRIIERAQEWVERLRPDKQKARKGFVYQSLTEEKNQLEAQANRAVILLKETMDLYHQIHEAADDLDMHVMALRAKETRQIQKDIKDATSELEKVLKDFENQLRTASAVEINSLIKKSESRIASIVEAHNPGDSFSDNETANKSSYTPKIGEKVLVKGLGDKLATIAETSGDGDTVLVQYGKLRVQVKKNNITSIKNSKKNVATGSVSRQKTQVRQRGFAGLSEAIKDEQVSYGPLVQTSKNTVDLRGMRVEEAAEKLNIAIATAPSYAVLFVVHGMGTGAVKRRAHEILKNHTRVAKFGQDDPMNDGCTVAYIN